MRIFLRTRATEARHGPLQAHIDSLSYYAVRLASIDNYQVERNYEQNDDHIKKFFKFRQGLRDKNRHHM